MPLANICLALVQSLACGALHVGEEMGQAVVVENRPILAAELGYGKCGFRGFAGEILRVRFDSRTALRRSHLADDAFACSTVGGSLWNEGTVGMAVRRSEGELLRVGFDS